MSKESGKVAQSVTPTVEIKSETIPLCLLCGYKGKPLYIDCRDYTMGVPGVYGFSICYSCQLVWLSPRPVAEDMIKCYPAEYYTHQAPDIVSVSDGEPPLYNNSTLTLKGRLREAVLDGILESKNKADEQRKWISHLFRIVSSIPLIRLRAIHFYNVTEEIPPFHPGARLLEIGCGSGSFLAKMRNKGWQVFGVDMDYRSAKIAKSFFGIEVFTGDLQDAGLPDASFEAIVMKHVIEHIRNPIELLVECFRVLVPGGWLGIITPNINSLGHRVFIKHWFALEIPRHLYLFSPSVLKKCVQKSGFEVILAYTQANMAYDIYEASLRICEKADCKRISVRASRFASIEKMIVNIFPEYGEEIVLIARKGVEA